MLVIGVQETGLDDRSLLGNIARVSAYAVTCVTTRR